MIRLVIAGVLTLAQPVPDDDGASIVQKEYEAVDLTDPNQVHTANAEAAASQARQAAHVANAVATHAKKITSTAQEALHDAHQALKGAAKSAELGEKQKEHLNRAADKLEEATQKAEYGKIKQADWLKVKKEEDGLQEDLERLQDKLSKISSAKSEHEREDVAAKRSKLKELREIYDAMREKAAVDHDAQDTQQLQEGLEELQRQLDELRTQSRELEHETEGASTQQADVAQQGDGTADQQADVAQQGDGAANQQTEDSAQQADEQAQEGQTEQQAVVSEGAGSQQQQQERQAEAVHEHERVEVEKAHDEADRLSQAERDRLEQEYNRLQSDLNRLRRRQQLEQEMKELQERLAKIKQLDQPDEYEETDLGRKIQATKDAMGKIDKDGAEMSNMEKQLQELEEAFKKLQEDRLAGRPAAVGAPTEDSLKAEIGRLQEGLERLRQEQEAEEAQQVAEAQGSQDGPPPVVHVESAVPVEEGGDQGVPAGLRNELEELEEKLKTLRTLDELRKLHQRIKDLKDQGRESEVQEVVEREGYQSEEDFEQKLHEREDLEQEHEALRRQITRYTPVPDIDSKPLPLTDDVTSATHRADGVTPSGGMDIDTSMPFGELEPFGREDTAQELTENAIDQSDKMVDQMERAEVSEEKRSVFRALTRLRGAAITSFDGVARSQTGNIDEYNKTHKWRKTHPLHHLAAEESDISRWAFPSEAD